MSGCDQSGLIPFEQALSMMMAEVVVTAQTETIYLEQAVGRVLATSSEALVNVPPADNSSMDGYAVNSASIKPGRVYSVSQRIAAGTPPEPLLEGTVARIFTGAEIPLGANAVVMQENVRATDEGVVFEDPVTPFLNVRAAGQDIAVGTEVLPVGTRLQPADLGVLASTGLDSLSVYRPLKVAILSTGNELADPGQSLRPGQIYNSNRYVLIGLLQRLGMEPIVMNRVDDSLEATIEALKHAAEQADCVISTGGVSVGEEDHVRQAVESIGEVGLWRLKMKPGKPLAFGKIAGTPFFGLPGNPASTLITFCLLARPFLLAMQGVKDQRCVSYEIPSGFSLAAGSRQEYLRVQIQSGVLSPYHNQSSGVLSSASWADGLAVVPPEKGVSEGDRLTFLSFADLLN